jgi:hypothetical protein
MTAISVHSVLAEDNTDDYPADVRAEYLDSCTAGREERSATCLCTLEKLEQTYTLAEYQRMNQRVIQGDRLPEVVLTIISSCQEDPNSWR